jgi:hypothetical protein
LGMGGMGLDFGQDRQSLTLGKGASGQDQRRGAVGIG